MKRAFVREARRLWAETAPETAYGAVLIAWLGLLLLLIGIGVF